MKNIENPNNERVSIGQLDSNAQNNGSRSAAGHRQSEMHDRAEESEFTKFRRALQSCPSMVDYLRNIFYRHPTAFKITLLSTASALFIFFLCLQFYYKVMVGVLALVLVGASNMAADEATIVNSAVLSSLVLLVFFLMACWPVTQLPSIIIYAFVAVRWAISSFRKRKYIDASICIIGSFATLLFYVLSRVGIVDPSIVWMLMVPSMFYMAFFFNIGFVGFSSA
ncbi:hypothetical protein NEMIN01_0297 [Nematocida minor]|uniref:uncharacterized protein n=1 Tax=Nematocida minor TaxID=1912983 RepID=UPI0022209023|nr:uncharacterized protein NEMIN01_0297 [Nematocida minor]KAI5189131.1 hypothetical protein NEMIN01_0297 [Nematocida minor]